MRVCSWRIGWGPVLLLLAHLLGQDVVRAAPMTQEVPTPTAPACANFTSCAACRVSDLSCTWCPSRQTCLSQSMVGICRDPALMCPVEEDKDTGKETRCSSASDCGSCMKLGNECGWCPTASRCQLHTDACERGWSNTTCYAVCPSDKTPLHDTAGVVQLGAQTPHVVPYLPGETCMFTVWPLMDSSSNRRSTLIRLQFEYVDLGPGDRVEIFSNTVDGPRLASVTGSGENIINRIITSRSTAVVVKFISEGTRSGAGFRLYYRVIQGSPLDIYLISAIIVTSILTCVLCSCCCNNCVAVIADHSGRLTGTRQPRALSIEEKERLPTCPYNTSEKHTYDAIECCICLSDFELGETVRELPCQHIFHPGCIDTWLEFNTLCPLCKMDVRTRPDGTMGPRSGRRRLIPLRRPRAARGEPNNRMNAVEWFRQLARRQGRPEQPATTGQETATGAAGEGGVAVNAANMSHPGSRGADVADAGDVELGWTVVYQRREEVKEELPS